MDRGLGTFSTHCSTFKKNLQILTRACVKALDRTALTESVHCTCATSSIHDLELSLRRGKVQK